MTNPNKSVFLSETEKQAVTVRVAPLLCSDHTLGWEKNPFFDALRFSPEQLCLKVLIQGNNRNIKTKL